MVSPLLSHAHNPLSARYHLDIGTNASLLTINLSQDGVNHLLSKKMSRTELEGMNSTQLEKLIVDYIKNNFQLSIGKKDITLKEGGIKLGSHQTNLKFVLPPFSENIEKMRIDVPAFQENNNHQTIFSYSIKGKTDHIILNADNDYQSTITLSASTTSNNWTWIAFIGILISLIIFLSRTIKVTSAYRFVEHIRLSKIG